MSEQVHRGYVCLPQLVTHDTNASSSLRRREDSHFGLTARANCAQTEEAHAAVVVIRIARCFLWQAALQTSFSPFKKSKSTIRHFQSLVHSKASWLVVEFKSYFLFAGLMHPT